MLHLGGNRLARVSSCTLGRRRSSNLLENSGLHDDQVCADTMVVISRAAAAAALHDLERTMLILSELSKQTTGEKKQGCKFRGLQVETVPPLAVCNNTEF